MRLDRGVCLAIGVAALMCGQAAAGGPRFVTGRSFGQPGQMMAFYTGAVTYATDPEALSANVSHAQADAMVATAAAVWNIPVANVTLTQHGTLAEHVSSANVYFSGSQLVWPNDVQASNYLSVPIAVIYDRDGSVTDLLLGAGASDPAGCRQHGVTESVDGFGQTGTIEHALVILNGRCAGGNAQQLLQMQYQTMRAFGRVLGLAWAQVNDNVFTGVETVSPNQMANWPVMHPMDVICGTYTYQCMQNPFALRPDDIASLVLLYPVTASNALAGKTPSWAASVPVEGWTYFGNGQGMDLLNMTMTRTYPGLYSMETWQVTAGVTGVLFQQDGGNPVSGAPSAAETAGSALPEDEARYFMGSVPVDPPSTGLLVQVEAINPLYTGDYALGPYERPPMSVAGNSPAQISPFALAGGEQPFWTTMDNEPSGCSPGADGTETAPAAADPSGWWNGLLCGVGHASWWSMAAKAGHSWTLETTAVDESGDATVLKAQPVLGVWSAGDPAGTLPTVAAQPVAMNGRALGVTQLAMPSAAADATYRIVVADQFGAGRPDFGYGARILYVDTVSPPKVGLSGGEITITGSGFREGNHVLVNGVAATVQSWSATQIVATVPAEPAGSYDVEVLDDATGAVSQVAVALSYAPGAVTPGAPAQVTIVSGAGQSVAPGNAFAPVIAQVNDGNGNAVPGASVTVHQTVYAWEGTCPAQGPCASAPVLQTSEATPTSGTNGQVSIVPLVVPGVAQTVEIAISSGATGFVSLSLVVQ